MQYALNRGAHIANSVRLGQVRRFRFVVEDLNSGQLIGLGLLQQSMASGAWEVGYAIASELRRLGYGNEVVTGLLGFANEFSPHGIVEAVPRKDNFPSHALLLKLGFKREDPDLNATEVPEGQHNFILRY